MGVPSTSPYDRKMPPGRRPLEATWYSSTSFDIDVDLTDGQTHEVTLYALDWDAVVGAGIQRRDERIDVIDPATNTVLATQTVTNFFGEYVSFSIKGSVILRVTNLAPPGPSSSNAIVSGIFFGAAAAVNTPTASLVGTDSTTLGNWRTAYGGDGYDIAQDTSGGNPVQPSYGQATVSGASNFTWASPSTSPYALQDAAGTAALEATWYSSTSFDIDVDLTDGQAHEVTLYALDWDAVVGAGIQRRDERIDVIDAATNKVLATQTLTNFLGEYVSFNIQGSVVIRVTNLAPPGPSSSNAVVSGIFFGAAAAVSTPTASFVQLIPRRSGTGTLRRTAGDGYDIVQDTTGGNPVPTVVRGRQRFRPRPTSPGSLPVRAPTLCRMPPGRQAAKGHLGTPRRASTSTWT